MKTATSDEQLMVQLAAGQSQALDELYRRYSAKLCLFCSKAMYVSNPEDAVHDIFMRVIEAASQFRQSDASFRAWVFQIARNRCIDLARRQKRVKAVALDPQDLADDGPNAVLRMDVLEAVNGCIEELPDDDERQAFVLFYMHDKVYREIGESLGKSTTMAHKRVSAARERMKRCLERKGVA